MSRKQSTQTASESLALTAAERAKRKVASAPSIPSAPAPQAAVPSAVQTLSATELESFRAWQAQEQQRKERNAIGMQSLAFGAGSTTNTRAFAIDGEMPAAPKENGAFLNDNKKVAIGGKVFTCVLSLYPYSGKATLEQLRARGEVIGEF